MNIACPHCGFSREVPEDKVPDRPVKVTCPKCQQGFTFDKTAATVAEAFDATFGDSPAAETPATTTCPACGLAQPASESCGGCGVIYAKWAARHEAREQAPPPQGETAFPGRAAYAAAASPAELPKAGFWVRVGASLIDTILLIVVQFAIEGALGLIGGDLDELAMAMIGGLCSMVISLTYYIFFTGYNGQTPGKMALRIQVVRTDGTPMSYGRAFLREVVGKFVSGIVLGIGYLVVAFDRNKQGWHDRIAGTYVVRL